MEKRRVGISSQHLFHAPLFPLRNNSNLASMQSRKHDLALLYFAIEIKLRRCDVVADVRRGCVLGYTKIESTVRYFGIEIDDAAVELAVKVDI